jgi:hypothetical protein
VKQWRAVEGARGRASNQNESNHVPCNALDLLIEREREFPKVDCGDEMLRREQIK